MSSASVPIHLSSPSLLHVDSSEVRTVHQPQPVRLTAFHVAHALLNHNNHPHHSLLATHGDEHDRIADPSIDGFDHSPHVQMSPMPHSHPPYVAFSSPPPPAVDPQQQTLLPHTYSIPIAPPVKPSSPSVESFDSPSKSIVPRRVRVQRCLTSSCKYTYMLVGLAVLLTWSVQVILIRTLYRNNHCRFDPTNPFPNVDVHASKGTLFSQSSFTPNYTLFASPPVGYPTNMSAQLLFDSLRLHHFRMVGTHNSYHEPSSLHVDVLDYRHMLLPDQLNSYAYGLRQLELDVHIVAGPGGWRVYHLMLWDDHATCSCLSECLYLIRRWSDSHPLHFPLFIYIELKNQLYEDMDMGLNGVKCDDIGALEQQFLQWFPTEKLILPEHVQGNFSTLKQALQTQAKLDRVWQSAGATLPAPVYEGYGWPTLQSSLGKVAMIWLDDVYNIAETIPCVRESFERSGGGGRSFFISQTHLDRSYAAFVSLPRAHTVDGQRAIAEAINSGLIIRTLTNKGIQPDPSRYMLGIQTGVHVSSTDFERCSYQQTVPAAYTDPHMSPFYNRTLSSTYCERTLTGWPFECNHITAPAWCQTLLDQLRARAAAINH